MLGVLVLVIRLACGLVNVDLFKSLAHIDYGERDHTVVQNSWSCHAWFSVDCLEVSTKSI